MKHTVEIERKRKDCNLSSWCRIVAEDGSTVGYTPDHVTARIHAAAPELLEALRVAVSYIGKGVADGAFFNCAVSGEKALEKMQATIRKAEGR